MTPSPLEAPRVAVVTIVRGRHDHLRGQLWGLRRQTRVPDLHVVVAMDDPQVPGVLALEDTPWPTRVVPLAAPDGRLPLSAARNAGAAVAATQGATVLVVLDVDCIPAPGLVARYAEVVADLAGREPDRPVLACGEVRYLDAGTSRLGPGLRTWHALDRGSRVHPARPAVPAGVTRAEDERLFWSLSFATTPRSWTRLGGFDEGYLGYGGEDTDFGQRLRHADGAMFWVGGALAYHQHHESQSPPVRHVVDVVANANRFAARWGWWPMHGWLEELDDLGLVRREEGGTYVVTARGRQRAGVVPPSGGPATTGTA